MRRETEGNKLPSTYRQSIYINHVGKNPMLECTCTNPRSLRKLVAMMRQKNPRRVYTTDDPLNP